MLSPSSCFRRLIADGMSPPYLLRHRQYVWIEIPALRQTSSTVVPSSNCFNMKAICCSLNLDFFMPRISRMALAKPDREILTKNGPV